MAGIIRAPFTDEQVARLNRWQANRAVHPYTCGAGHHISHVSLVATADGWVCPEDGCDYTQDWAHDIVPGWNAKRPGDCGPPGR